MTGWLSGKTGSPSIDTVKKTAVAFGVPIAEALIAAEYIEESDLNIKRLAPDPDLLTDTQILDQLEKRLGIKPTRLTIQSPPTTVDNPKATPPKDPLRVADEQGRYELARMAGETEYHRRRRLEPQPEDEPQGEPPEWGA